VVDDDLAESCCETTATIGENLPPVCDAGGPYADNEGDEIMFDGSGSFDPDGTIVEWNWDFGDGSTGTGEMFPYTYAAFGVYTVGLCVVDNEGAESCCETTAMVNGFPLCDAGGPYAADQGEEITFDGTGSSDPEGGVLTYAWDFGDGTTGEGATAPHTYTTFGMFTVSLCVVDDFGAESCCETTADINALPICDANGPYVGNALEVVHFDGTGSSDPDGTIESYSWDFGDGETGSGATPDHIYMTPGLYTVTLCVVDDDQAESCCETFADIDEPVAVELAGFEITSEDGTVTITWETSFEQNNAGFHVRRALDGETTFERVNEAMIRGENREATYEFVDRTAMPGETYAYQLEAIDLRGSTQFFDLDAVIVARVLPKQMVLHQNRPNPFNPSTEIHYELAEAGHVSLRIYDAQGRAVRTLVNGFMPRDFHSVEWDGRDDHGRSLGSGIYIYRLQAAGTVLTQKMVLMK
jgi:PKD repeat protein